MFKCRCLTDSMEYFPGSDGPGGTFRWLNVWESTTWREIPGDLC